MIDGDIVITGHPVNRNGGVKQSRDPLYLGHLVVVVAFIYHVAAHYNESGLQQVGAFNGPCEKCCFGGESFDQRSLTNYQSALGEGRDFLISLAA